MRHLFILCLEIDEFNCSELPPLNVANALLQLKDINNIGPLGVHLHIPLSKIRQIEQENKDIERQKIEMIDFWLGNSKPSDCSWERLAEALNCVGGHSRLVSRLKNKLENNSLPEAEIHQSGILTYIEWTVYYLESIG